jgi:uncharacterized membrane protein
MQTQLRNIQETVVELIIIFILTLIAFPVVTLSEGVLRIILGVIFLLIFPGYTLMAALFPNENSIKGIERAALTFVLSFALVSLTGLVLNYTPWGIRLTPIFAAVAIIIVLTSGIALLRRAGIPEAERFALRINIRMPKWSEASRFDRVLSICLVIVVIGAISVLAYVIAQPKAEEAFTNFYILGPEGMMENYPQELTLGEQAEITLGMENHENQDASYDIVVMLDGKEMQAIGPIELADGKEWRNEVMLIPLQAGDNQKVEFLLYKGEESVPYLALHLWLDVKE